jgi:hypothetical protein
LWCGAAQNKGAVVHEMWALGIFSCTKEWWGKVSVQLFLRQNTGSGGISVHVSIFIKDADTFRALHPIWWQWITAIATCKL